MELLSSTNIVSNLHPSYILWLVQGDFQASGQVIPIDGVISMTVFLTGTHFFSGRPSLHAPPAAPPRRPDSRIPADNEDKGEVCHRGALDGRSANKGFFRNQHKFSLVM